MKALALILLLPVAANAADLELAVGETFFHPQHEGIWYQAGFPAQLNLNSPSLSIGGTGYATSWMRWHAGYTYLGSTSSEAVAVGSDAAYAKWGAEATQHGYNAAHWSGSGNVNMLYATLAPEYKSGAWTFSVEGGFTLYKPTWTEQVTGWNGCAYCHTSSVTLEHNGISAGEVVGFGVTYGHWELLAERYTMTANGDNVPAIYVHYANNVSLRYEF